MNDLNKTICFHHNDPDGKCAAAIVNRAISPDNIEFIEMKYSKEIPFDKIKANDEIIIVDFSFKPEQMELLFEISSDIIWIDHHKTILDHPWNNEDIRGIREVGKSGALLTWEYFADEESSNIFNKPIPLAVQLISDYDCWILKDQRSKPFVFGLQTYDLSPTSYVWDELFKEKDMQVKNVFIPRIIEKGFVCLAFIEALGFDYGTQYGFETKFEGYNCFAQGFYMFGSTAFGDRINQYDICISYEWLGDKWIIGLYSVKPEIDVSEIAKEWGGGGHKGAAGFVNNHLPFIKKD